MNERSVLIQGGTLVIGDEVSKKDVLIRGETISVVGEVPDGHFDEVFDATGLLVLPGAIDPHVHFNETNKGQYGVHDYLTGGRAAAFGGTTTIVDFADQIHGKPLLTVLEVKKEQAKGRITLPQLVDLVSTTPARLFGLAPKKGSLAVGADADIVLFDPTVQWTMTQESLHMASDYTSYEGVEVTGKVAKVFSRGELIVDGEEFLATPGRGQFLPCELE